MLNIESFYISDRKNLKVELNSIFFDHEKIKIVFGGFGTTTLFFYNQTYSDKFFPMIIIKDNLEISCCNQNGEDTSVAELINVISDDQKKWVIKNIDLINPGN